VRSVPRLQTRGRTLPCTSCARSLDLLPAAEIADRPLEVSGLVGCPERMKDKAVRFLVRRSFLPVLPIDKNGRLISIFVSTKRNHRDTLIEPATL
jgi:hypothetical protein